MVKPDTDHRDDGRTFRVSDNAWRCAVISGSAGSRWRGTWPVGALAAAGAAAPEALRAALARIAAAVERPLARRPGMELRFDRPISFDLSVPGLRAGPLRVPETDVVSGGAIATSMLFCLIRLPGLAANLRVIEPDVIELPNLNRYPLARRSDCGRRKADVLTGFGTPAVRIASVADRFSAATSKTIGPLASHVLVGVDDIPARWDVQRAAPGGVCVAGTSHLFALVTAHERGEPCAGCAHPRDEDIAAPSRRFRSSRSGRVSCKCESFSAGPPAPPHLIRCSTSGRSVFTDPARFTPPISGPMLPAQSAARPLGGSADPAPATEASPRTGARRLALGRPAGAGQGEGSLVPDLPCRTQR